MPIPTCFCVLTHACACVYARPWVLCFTLSHPRFEARMRWLLCIGQLACSHAPFGTHSTTQTYAYTHPTSARRFVPGERLPCVGFSSFLFSGLFLSIFSSLSKYHLRIIWTRFTRSSGPPTYRNLPPWSVVCHPPTPSNQPSLSNSLSPPKDGPIPDTRYEIDGAFLRHSFIHSFLATFCLFARVLDRLQPRPRFLISC